MTHSFNRKYRDFQKLFGIIRSLAHPASFLLRGIFPDPAAPQLFG